MAYRPKDEKERVYHRLRIARGHLDKVIRMQEEGVYCINVLHQSFAVQNALKEADALILENHLKTCASDAIKKGKSTEAIAEVMNVFRKQR